jgi:hypothetical protein
VYVSIVHIAKSRQSKLLPLLNGLSIPEISSRLDSNTQDEKPQLLMLNQGKSFAGSKLDGMGFVLEPEEAQALIARNSRNNEVLQPYLNGDDLNSRPDQSARRWVINFRDWDESRASQYSDCFEIVHTRVYPERQKHSEERTRTRWWQFQRIRPELYTAIEPLRRVLTVAQTSRTLAFVFVPKGQVYTTMTVVFAFDDYGSFAVLQSAFHENWVRRYASTLKTDVRYTPTDCFQTYPFPQPLLSNNVTQSATRTTLDAIGEQYHEHRRQIMLARQEGLTTTYNRFHAPDERNADIACLRDLHVEMDRAVAAAYAWDDLDLGHGFHETQQGIRFTLSETARREVLGRLLKLNHRRWEEEQKVKDEGGGMKDEVKKKGKRGKKKGGGDEGGSQMGMW